MSVCVFLTLGLVHTSNCIHRLYLLCRCAAGELIASSTAVDALFQHNFNLIVNDKRYLVKVTKEGTQPEQNE